MTEEINIKNWHWRSWNGLPYLTCSLLAPWQHGFFTRQFSPLMPADLVKVLQPDAEVYRVKQVHGNTVLTASEISKSISIQGNEVEETTSLSDADGIITEKTPQSVWVCSADCTPVLIADVNFGTVSAIHAGWRGTATRIVPQAIARFVASGSQLGDLRIAMGPAIAGKVYQVSIHVAAEVGLSLILNNNSLKDPESIVDYLHQLPNSPLLPDEKLGHVKLDVRRVNQLQLEQLGIAPQQMAIAPDCTYQESELFFSYRRDKLKNVQWSGIVS